MSAVCWFPNIWARRACALVDSSSDRSRSSEKAKNWKSRSDEDRPETRVTSGSADRVDTDPVSVTPSKRASTSSQFSSVLKARHHARKTSVKFHNRRDAVQEPLRKWAVNGRRTRGRRGILYKIGSPERKDRNSEQAITMANVEKVAATNPLIATVTRICVPWRCHFNDNIGLVNPELKNR